MITSKEEVPLERPLLLRVPVTVRVKVPVEQLLLTVRLRDDNVMQLELLVREYVKEYE